MSARHSIDDLAIGAYTAFSVQQLGPAQQVVHGVRARPDLLLTDQHSCVLRANDCAT